MSYHKVPQTIPDVSGSVNTWQNNGWWNIPLSVQTFVTAFYIVAAVVIANGGTAGKASSTQTVLLGFFCTMFAAANLQIGNEIGVFDAGGSSHVHLFGAGACILLAVLRDSRSLCRFRVIAGFGWGASRILAAPVRPNDADQKRTRATGAFGLIGTLILFITYPVFNSAQVPYWVTAASNTWLYSPAQWVCWTTPGPAGPLLGWDGLSSALNTGGASCGAGLPTLLSLYYTIVSGIQTRAFINTLCGIAASVMSTFMASRWWNDGKKFNFAHIQMATIVGGATTAAMAPWCTNPFGPILASMVTASTSVLWINRMKADTNGAFAVHVWPAFIGICSAAIAAGSTQLGFNPTDTYNVIALSGLNQTPYQTGGRIMAYGAISLAHGYIAGIVCAFIALVPIFSPKQNSQVDDSEEWGLVDEQEQAGYDITNAAVAPKTVAADAPAAAAAAQ